MRTKLTVTVDRDLIPKAKERARAEGLSLSRLIERALAAITTDDGITFAKRWRGRFRPADRRSPRYEALRRKYL